MAEFIMIIVYCGRISAQRKVEEGDILVVHTQARRTRRRKCGRQKSCGTRESKDCTASAAWLAF